MKAFCSWCRVSFTVSLTFRLVGHFQSFTLYTTSVFGGCFDTDISCHNFGCTLHVNFTVVQITFYMSTQDIVVPCTPYTQYMVPYLTDDCQLVANSGRLMYRTSDKDLTRQQELHCHRSTVLEHFASGTLLAGHWTCDISAAAKNICLSVTQVHSDRHQLLCSTYEDEIWRQLSLWLGQSCGTVCQRQFVTRTVYTLKRRLKSHLFSLCFNDWQCNALQVRFRAWRALNFYLLNRTI